MHDVRLICFPFCFIGFRWPAACDEWPLWSELKTQLSISQLQNTCLFTFSGGEGNHSSTYNCQGIKSPYKLKKPKHRSTALFNTQSIGFAKLPTSEALAEKYQLWVLNAKVRLNSPAVQEERGTYFSTKSTGLSLASYLTAFILPCRILELPQTHKAGNLANILNLLLLQLCLCFGSVATSTSCCETEHVLNL